MGVIISQYARNVGGKAEWWIENKPRANDWISGMGLNFGRGDVREVRSLPVSLLETWKT